MENVICHILLHKGWCLRMKKQRTLVLKLSLLTIGVFLLLFAIYNVISNSIVYTNSKSTSEENITLLTENTALQIQKK